MNQTNNVGELLAIKRALEIVRNEPKFVEIYTDSDYSIKCLTEWGDKWEKNGWCKTSGGKKEPVKNLELIKPAREILKERGGNT